MAYKYDPINKILIKTKDEKVFNEKAFIDEVKKKLKVDVYFDGRDLVSRSGSTIMYNAKGKDKDDLFNAILLFKKDGSWGMRDSKTVDKDYKNDLINETKFWLKTNGIYFRSISGSKKGNSSYEIKIMTSPETIVPIINNVLSHINAKDFVEDVAVSKSNGADFRFIVKTKDFK